MAGVKKKTNKEWLTERRALKEKFYDEIEQRTVPLPKHHERTPGWWTFSQSYISLSGGPCSCCSENYTFEGIIGSEKRFGLDGKYTLAVAYVKREADLALIAAAPALLQACKMLVDRMAHNALREAAMLVIAQAEGHQDGKEETR